jgi:hypothetical protein
MRATGKAADRSPRQAALKEGLTRYFTGEQCKHGHVAERIARNSVCVVCDSKRHAQWHLANKQRANEASRRYRKKQKQTEPNQTAVTWGKSSALIKLKLENSKSETENTGEIAMTIHQREITRILDHAYNNKQPRPWKRGCR